MADPSDLPRRAEIDSIRDRLAALLETLSDEPAVPTSHGSDLEESTESRDRRAALRRDAIDAACANVAGAPVAWLRFVRSVRHRLIRGGREALLQIAASEPERSVIHWAGLDAIQRYNRGKVVLLRRGPRPSVCDGACVQTVECHDADILDVTIDPTGSRVASISRDGKLLVLERSTWRTMASVDVPATDGSRLAFDVDGQRVVVSTSGREIWVVDVAGGAVLSRWSVGGASFALLAHRGRVAYVAPDERLAARDLATQVAREVGRPSVKGSVLLAAHPDGDRLYSVGSRGKVQLWTPGAQAEPEVLGEIDSGWTALRAIGDRGELLGVGYHGADVWHPATGVDAAWRELLRESVGVEVVRAGRWVSARRTGSIAVLDAAERAPCGTLGEHAGGVRAAVFDARANELITAGRDGSLRVWSLEEPAVHADAGRHGASVTCVAITPDERWAVSGAGDGSVRFWNLASGEVHAPVEPHGGSTRACTDVGPTRVATAGSDGRVVVWDVVTGDPHASVRWWSDEPTSVLASADGETVYIGGGDGRVAAWNLREQAYAWTSDLHDRWIDRLKRAWSTGKLAITQQRVCALSLAAHGRDLLAVLADGTTHALDATTGRWLRCFEHGAAMAVQGFALIEPTRALYLQRDEALFDVERGECIERYALHRGGVVAWAADRDARFAAIATHRGTVHLYSLRERVDRATWHGDERVTACAVGVDATLVLGDVSGHVTWLEANVG